MTIEQITDMAWEVVSELEPARDLDVFEGNQTAITFQAGRKLFRVSLKGLSPMAQSLKDDLKHRLKNGLCVV